MARISATRLLVLLFIGFCSISNLEFCHAQENQKEYIIFNDGDTLFGDLSIQNAWSQLESFDFDELVLVHFESSDTSTFKTADCREVFIDFETEGYHLVRKIVVNEGLLETSRLLRLVAAGKLNLYEFRTPLPDRKRLEEEFYKGVLKTYESTYFLQNDSTPLESVKTYSFKKQMLKLMEDDEDLTKLIEDGVIQYDMIEEAVKLYDGLPTSALDMSKFVDGYVELVYGNKIYCKLELLDENLSCQILSLVDYDGRPVHIRNDQVSSYRRANELYVARTIEPKKKRETAKQVFMKELVSGEVSLLEYKYLDKNRTNFFLNDNQYGNWWLYQNTFHPFPMPSYYYNPIGFFVFKAPISKSQHADYYLERNDTLKQVVPNSFKKEMAKYFEESEEISKKIKDKEYRFVEIGTVVQEFNKLFK